MIERKISDRMRAAVADEPLLGFDPDEVVTRAARKRRNLRAVTATAVTAVAAVITAAVVSLPTGGQGGALQVAGSPSQPATKQAPPDTCGYPWAPVKEADIVKKLRRVAPKIVTDHAPDVRVEAVEPIGSSCPLKGNAGFTLPGTDQHFALYEIRYQEGLDLVNTPSTGGLPDQISDKPGAHGSRVEVYQGTNSAESVRAVMHRRADGTVTLAYLWAPPLKTIEHFALTVPQLQGMATDPRLAFPS